MRLHADLLELMRGMKNPDRADFAVSVQKEHERLARIENDISNGNVGCVYKSCNWCGVKMAKEQYDSGVCPNCNLSPDGSGVTISELSDTPCFNCNKLLSFLSLETERCGNCNASLHGVNIHGHPVHVPHPSSIKSKMDTLINDPVNHPKHYRSHPSGIECITIARHMSFNIGNVIKYLWRADEKGAPLQDLEKAAWYLKDEIERRKAQPKDSTPNPTAQ